MKLKQTPDDFQVEELTSRRPSAGPFAFYSLAKQDTTTLDALAAIRRRWKIDARRVSFGGLKDRHAATRQHFTIYRGPSRNLEQRGIRVTYLGMTDRPFVAADIDCNRFQIVVRDLSAAAVATAEANVTEVIAAGLPNYFDDQRFGSFTAGVWPARLMILGKYAEALKLLLAAPYEFDSAAQRRDKAILRRNWGAWARCVEQVKEPATRRLLRHLADRPDDFRGAVAFLQPDMQGLFLSAYQSYLWNRMLAELLVERCRSDQLVAIAVNNELLPAPQSAIELGINELPYPSARLHDDPAAPWHSLVHRVLADQGFTLEKMKLPGLRRPFFSKGSRPIIIRPANLQARPATDSRNGGRQALTLTFDLPRGCYATILIKRLLPEASGWATHQPTIT